MFMQKILFFTLLFLSPLIFSKKSCAKNIIGEKYKLTINIDNKKLIYINLYENEKIIKKNVFSGQEILSTMVKEKDEYFKQLQKEVEQNSHNISIKDKLISWGPIWALHFLQDISCIHLTSLKLIQYDCYINLLKRHSILPAVYSSDEIEEKYRELINDNDIESTDAEILSIVGTLNKVIKERKILNPQK